LSIEFFFVNSSGVEESISMASLQNYVVPSTISPGGLVNILQFRPALDDFNVDNTEEVRSKATFGGHKGAFFCQIEYTVTDSAGAVSLTTKTITVTVLQINDLPREQFDVPNNNDNQIDLSNFLVNEIIGFEDSVLFFRLDAMDVEGDDFKVVIFDCDPANGQFFGPSSNQKTYLDSNGQLLLNTSANILFDAFAQAPIDCSAAQTSTLILNTTFSQTNGLGWWLYFVPNLDESGQNYNKLSLLYDDGIQAPNKIYGSFRFITILPVNHCPQIWYNSPDNGTSIPLSYDNTKLLIIDPLDYTGEIQVNGTATIDGVINSGYNFGLVFSDTDSLGSTNMNFEIYISNRPSSSSGSNGSHGSFSGFNGAGVNVITQASDKLIWISSIDQANLAIKTLSFTADAQGLYTIEINIADNGATGRYCPPGKYFQIGQKSCPRFTHGTINISGLPNQGFLLGVGTGVGAGVLALAAIGAALGAKFLKPKETDGWNEWDTDNMGDVALSNPFYEQQTTVQTNEIYDKDK